MSITLQAKNRNKLKTLCLFFSLMFITCSSNTFATEQEKIRLALYFDKGAHPRSLLRENLSKDPSISMVVVDGEAIREGCLNKFDVLFVPGGSGKTEAFSLGEEGRNKVCHFVKNGGIYVGVCAGCYLASCARAEYLNLLPATTVDKEHWRRGKATLPITFTKLGMEIFGCPQETVNVIYHNGPVLRPLNNHGNEIVPLSYFRGEAVAKGGTAGLMINAPAMVLGRYGNGLVLGISPHPEATPGLTTIELNAIHWLYNHRLQNNLDTPIKHSLTNFSSIAPSSSNTITNALPLRIYNKAEEIFAHTTDSHYQHLHQGVDEQVQQCNGTYKTTTDCSGFVSYVINTVAPKHYAVIREMTGRSYPHAETFATFFRELPNNSSTNGWLKIVNYRDLQRGDIIAWERSQHSEESNKRHNGSGHVMIIVNPPGKVITEIFDNRTIKYVEIYVLDSSSVEHFAPQSLPSLAHQNQRDGVGKGIVRLILDNQNNVIGFWEGTFSHEKNKTIKGPSYTNRIGFARLVSLTDATGAEEISPLNQSCNSDPTARSRSAQAF